MKSNNKFNFLILLFLLFFRAYSNNEITIIGAGLAGLSAAYYLQKEGYDVTIYEARNRPGGRVFTCYFDKSYNELGGQNINDGGEAKYIRSLIKELNLSIKSFNIKKQDLCYIEDNIESIDELLKSGPKTNEENYNFLKKNFSNLGDLLDKFIGKDTKLRKLIEMREACFEGINSDKLSMYYFDSFWNYYARSLKNCFSNKEKINFSIATVKGGMSKLIEALCNNLKNNIHYGSPLNKISLNKDNEIILQIGNETIVPKCTIITIPLSTLQDVEIENGIFPEDQINMVKTMQYGTNAKILIPTNQKTDTYARSNNAFAVHQNQVLWLYFGGTDGIFDSSSLKILEDVLNKELKYIEKLFPNLKFGSQIQIIPESTKSFITVNHPVGISWINEKYSKGSYSCLAPGQEKEYEKTKNFAGEKIRSIFRPIKNKVFFAGEHTSMHNPSTMEGAIESGKQVSLIIKNLKKIH